MNTSTIPELDRSGLRKFAWTTGSILAVLFGLFFPWVFEASIPTWPWVVFAILAVWGAIAPNTLRSVYKGWMLFGLLLSKITTPIVLGTVYYFVVTPMGIVMKLLGKDPMNRKLATQDISYRVPSIPPSKDNIDRPF